MAAGPGSRSLVLTGANRGIGLELVRQLLTAAEPSPAAGSQAFLPLLKKAAKESSQDGLSCRKAAIINISSVLGSMESVPLNYTKPAVPYRCSKAALNMLTKCLSLSYAGDGVLCTAVHPGWVKTDMGTQEADLSVDESVRGIISVLSKLGDKHNGVLVNWKGNNVPW
nr:C-signal-like [Anolis sagrei ordinatus]